MWEAQQRACMGNPRLEAQQRTNDEQGIKWRLLMSGQTTWSSHKMRVV